MQHIWDIHVGRSAWLLHVPCEWDLDVVGHGLYADTDLDPAAVLLCDLGVRAEGFNDIGLSGRQVLMLMALCDWPHLLVVASGVVLVSS